jgi:hypothetical protein
MNRWVVASLMAGVVLALPAPGSAQWAPVPAQQEQAQPPERKAKNPRARAPQPNLDEEDQLSPRQLDQRAPARPARQSEPPPGQADRPTAALPPSAAEGSRTAAEGARTIACSGVFGKDSSHLKLATRFDSRNLAFTEVDGPEGSRLMASVLFPNDPKRRLEVLWQNEASRTETHLIVINGRSTWTAPKGLRLGLPLAALEKLNGKPFRMSGFNQPNGGSAIDWDGGALDRLPGGCRLGIRLAPDAKATEAARNEVMGTEFVSNDPKMRAVRPIVAEILIGY